MKGKRKNKPQSHRGHKDSEAKKTKSTEVDKKVQKGSIVGLVPT